MNSHDQFYSAWQAAEATPSSKQFSLLKHQKSHSRSLEKITIKSGQMSRSTSQKMEPNLLIIRDCNKISGRLGSSVVRILVSITIEKRHLSNCCSNKQLKEGDRCLSPITADCCSQPPKVTGLRDASSCMTLD